MDSVAHISVTTTKKRDLIVTFAICDEKWPGGIRCLILLRSAAQEHVFEERERGIAVSMEGDDDDTKDIEGHLLTEFAFDAQTRTAAVKTRKHAYDLDLSKVKPDQIAQMWTHLTQMNFDRRAKVVGA